jgi:hypothetical protein
VLRRPTLLIVLAGLVACDSGQRSNPVQEAFAQARPVVDSGASVTFRFPATPNRDASLYRLPELEEVAWRFEAGSEPVAASVGFAGDDDLIYVLNVLDELVALDLASGRARVVDTGVVASVLGPTGTPFTVRHDGSVARISQRSAVAWSGGFDTVPTALWGAARDRLVALTPGEEARMLTLLADGQPPVSQQLPVGDVAVSRWGDVAGVAVDSGLVLVDPAGSAPRRFVELRNIPQRVAFSPSGHKAYVVGAWGVLVSVDRFGLIVQDSLALPGAAHSLRVDPFGRVLLVEAELGDVIWAVDVVDWRLVATLEGEWDAELPAIAPDGTVLLRHGGQVVALSDGVLTPVGRTADEEGDRWLLMAWDPRRPGLEFATTPGAPQADEESQLIYVQVSSTSNRDWAVDLATNLGRAGMQATVLNPRTIDEPYRVVLGPYPTRDEAESTGRSLGLPFWIFTLDTATTIP